MAVIIAVGCAGGRMVNHMAGRIEAEYLAINTDRRELDACLVGRKILIGEQRFQGRGGSQPHIIMEESTAAVEAIRQACMGRASVIIVAGLGGGTGTGIAPLVARIAQRQGCKTAAVVTKPLPWEGLQALAYALVALKTLASVDRLVTVPLVELLRRGISEVEVYAAGDELVTRAVVRLITLEGWQAPVESSGKEAGATARAGGAGRGTVRIMDALCAGEFSHDNLLLGRVFTE
jgi:cell division protein FtsZ